MTELEDIGRYHQLKDRLDAVVRQRNSALQRAGGLLSEAGHAPVNRRHLAKHCRFDAVDRLLAEARAADDALTAMLAELATLALIINKPTPTLE